MIRRDARTRPGGRVKDQERKATFLAALNDTNLDYLPFYLKGGYDVRRHD